MSVFPMYFEGAKLLVNKGLNNNFQVKREREKLFGLSARYYYS